MPRLALPLICLLLGACSHQRVYESTENYREESCKKTYGPNDPDRAVCLEGARRDWDDYERAREDAREAD